MLCFLRRPPTAAGTGLEEFAGFFDPNRLPKKPDTPDAGAFVAVGAGATGALIYRCVRNLAHLSGFS
jgi:hypothetical protein